MIKEKTDIQLIEGVLDNDTKSENELYDRYYTYIKNFLKKNYTLYYDLEDEVSEILIKIFMGLNTYNPKKSSFSSWVCSIAKNHMVDKWRSNDVSYVLTTNNSGNYITSSTSYVNESSTDTSFEIYSDTTINVNTSTECEFISNTEYETWNTISYVVSDLSTSDCTFLNMKYLYGYDYNEIGNEFNVSSNSVSNRVNYIKNKLKKSRADVMD